MDIFSARLKFIREKTEFSQKDIAEKVGMSPQGYGKLELGTREPKLEVLAKFPLIFNESTDFLLGVTDLDSVATKYFNDYFQLSNKIHATIKRINELTALAFDPDMGSGGLISASNDTVTKIYLESVKSDEFRKKDLKRTILRYLETIPYVSSKASEVFDEKEKQTISDSLKDYESFNSRR